MTTVAVIRPGATEFDEQHRIQGNLDLPLSKHGESQLPAIVTALQGLHVEAVYASPSDPARSTAEFIAAALDCPLKLHEGLANVNLGLWQGLQINDFRRKHPKLHKVWEGSPSSICPPEGERIPDAVERIQKTLQKPLKKDRPVAFIAPEPLATLIAAAVSGEKLHSICPIASEEAQDLVEIIDTENGHSRSAGRKNPRDKQAVRQAVTSSLSSRGDNSDELGSKT
jgi:probable phosphoglycerate mutase